MKELLDLPSNAFVDHCTGTFDDGPSLWWDISAKVCVPGVDCSKILNNQIALTVLEQELARAILETIRRCKVIELLEPDGQKESNKV